jgi:hypothetical protein
MRVSSSKEVVMKLWVVRVGRTVVLPAVAALMLSGCAVLDAWFGVRHRPARQSHNSSSLVEFLYPGGRVPPAQNQIPELRVPLRVRLAFLPSQNGAGPGASSAR